MNNIYACGWQVLVKLTIVVVDAKCVFFRGFLCVTLVCFACAAAFDDDRLCPYLKDASKDVFLCVDPCGDSHVCVANDGFCEMFSEASCNQMASELDSPQEQQETYSFHSLGDCEQELLRLHACSTVEPEFGPLHEQKAECHFVCDPLGDRAQQLLAFLQKGTTLSFATLQDSLYKDLFKQQYYEDILCLKRVGVQILVNGDEIIYRGMRDSAQKCQKKTVAQAMLTILNEGFESGFSLQSRLYDLGYVHYPPGDLVVLEQALIVGGAHPYGGKVCLSSRAGFFSNLRRIWLKNRNATKEAFQEFVQKQDAEYIPVLTKLKALKESGELESLMRFVRRNPLNQKGAQICRGSRQGRVLEELWSRPGKSIAAEVLHSIVLPEKEKKGIPAFVRDVLNLVLQGFPIYYNKRECTFLISPEEEVVVEPAKGTNLATAIYDCVCEYKGDLCVEEIAYYACRKGHWNSGFSWHSGVRKNFHARIRLYKRFLVVLGFFGKKVLSCDEGLSTIDVNVRLWKMVMAQCVSTVDKALFCNDPSVTDESIVFLKKLKNFFDGLEHSVLTAYITVRHGGGVKDVILNWIVCQPCTYSRLWRRCRESELLEKVDDLWQILGTLTLQKALGRVVYCPEKRVFRWDVENVTPCARGGDGCLEILRLKYQYAYMTEWLLVHMLRQQGFVGACKSDVHTILCGLEVLGLRLVYCSKSDECDLFALGRLLDLVVMDAGTHPVTFYTQRGFKEQDAMTALRVLSWVRGDMFALLWKEYAHLNGQVPVNDSDVPPAKFPRVMSSAENAIKKYAPKLHKTLYEKGYLTL